MSGKARLEDIQSFIQEDIDSFEKLFRESMRSKVMLLDKIMTYIVKRKGKQIRPMFVFLSARLHGQVNESTYSGAALIELLHTATLVHDDVVDDSNYRRGFFSINALWKNKIAILVGDYLLSRGLLLAIDRGEFNLLQLVSNAVREMSEGELLQIEKARKLDITEVVYYDIIRQKTASLIASCCAVGAASVGANKETVEQMKMFGECIGMAFQIKDDLFDYETTQMIGKPVGIDIKEKKMTLPLIYALSNSDRKEKARIISIIKNESHKPDKVKEVIAFVVASGGIAYAHLIMTEYQQKAFAMLDQFPDSEIKEPLKKLVEFTINRTK
ncbi:MAG: polyprenyl synthetase family protein [Cytophagaceae bacterium]|nr:polyprenyl synthetase family protein [Cytophagaceae bacterium]